MDPQLIAKLEAAIDPQPKPSAPATTDPAAAPQAAEAPPTKTRRGRPPKKPDDAYRAALAAITGAEDAAVPKWTRSVPPEKRPYHRPTFRKLPRATDAGAAPDAPVVNVEAAKAILKPREGVRREWPVIPNGPKAPPPRVSPEELQQIVNFYWEKYGPILSLDEAAGIAKVAKQTLRQWVCQGCFPDAVFRGRPLRFLTLRFVPEVVR